MDGQPAPLFNVSKEFLAGLFKSILTSFTRCLDANKCSVLLNRPAGLRAIILVEPNVTTEERSLEAKETTVAVAALDGFRLARSSIFSRMRNLSENWLATDLFTLPSRKGRR